MTKLPFSSVLCADKEAQTDVSNHHIIMLNTDMSNEKGTADGNSRFRMLHGTTMNERFLRNMSNPNCLLLSKKAMIHRKMS